MSSVHPFQHTGTSQTSRLLRALIPENLQLDNSKLEDIMVFANKFSKTIKFWNEKNQEDEDGDWASFWQADALFFLADVAAADTEGLEKEYRLLEKKLISSDKTEQANVQPMLDAIYKLAKDIEQWGERANHYPIFQKDVQQLIATKLRPKLFDLIAYDKSVAPNNNYSNFMLDHNSQPTAAYWDLTYHKYTQLDFTEYGTNADALSLALRKIFQAFADARMRLETNAERYLRDLQNDPNRAHHQPHIALFLAFLQLFRHLQDQINGLTATHLDYFYRDILQLQQRAEIPDQAHLVFQLALGIYQQQLNKGTLLKGGKTPDGRDLLYALDRNLVLNQAVISEVKTLLVTRPTGGGILLAREFDVQNAAKMLTVKPFLPFGGSDKDTLAEVGFAIASSQLVSSAANRLVTIKIPFTTTSITDFSALKVKISGEKTWIEPKFNPSMATTPLKSEDLEYAIKIENNSFNIYLKIGKKHGAFSSPKGYKEANAPIKTELPVIKVYLDKDVVNTTKLIPELSNVSIGEIEITIKADDVTDFKIREGSNFLFNGSTRNVDLRQFSGKSLQVDAFDVLNKKFDRSKNDKFKFNIKQQDPTFIPEVYMSGQQMLVDGTWQDVVTANPAKLATPTSGIISASSFDSTSGARDIGDSISRFSTFEALKTTFPFLNNPTPFMGSGINFNTNTFNNYQVDRLNNLLGKPNFADLKDKTVTNLTLTLEQKVQISQLLADTLFEIPIDKTTIFDLRTPYSAWLYPVQNLPQRLVEWKVQPIPFLKEDNKTPINATVEFSINYQSTDKIKYGKTDDDEIYHLTSHKGYKRIFSKNIPFLLPIFGKSENGESGEPNGNLFIGLKNAHAGQIMSLLFQVIPDSETEFSKKFTPEIDWAYLTKEGTWNRFSPTTILFDSTKADPLSKRSLVRSGVVELLLPEEAQMGSTLLNEKLIWIRVAATESANSSIQSLPLLSGIFAQAGVVTLVTPNVGASHFDLPLPANTINQLKIRQSAIRKVEQPFVGFGGAKFEQGSPYYRRVSERLRHRNRAITAWDFEHLVLEAFPDMRFVKCINHTSLNGTTYSELAPGHVTLAVVPNATRTPLEPQVGQAKRDAIKAFLEKRATAFLKNKIHVTPPQYQHIQIDISVKFREGDIEKMKHDLDDALIQMLAPWAFDTSLDIPFNGKIYRSDLISQIENLAYVDFIDSLKLFEIKYDLNGKPLPPIELKKIDGTSIDIIKPIYASSILTSFQKKDKNVFDFHHTITSVSP
jgi:hypothetical protein